MLVATWGEIPPGVNRNGSATAVGVPHDAVTSRGALHLETTSLQRSDSGHRGHQATSTLIVDRLRAVGLAQTLGPSPHLAPTPTNNRSTQSPTVPMGIGRHRSGDGDRTEAECEDI